MSDEMDLDDIFATADDIEDSPDTIELNRLKAQRHALNTAEVVLERNVAAVQRGEKPVVSRTPEYRKAKTRALTRLAQKHPREYKELLKECLATVGIKE